MLAVRRWKGCRARTESTDPYEDWRRSIVNRVEWTSDVCANRKGSCWFNQWCEDWIYNTWTTICLISYYAAGTGKCPVSFPFARDPLNHHCAPDHTNQLSLDLQEHAYLYKALTSCQVSIYGAGIRPRPICQNRWFGGGKCAAAKVSWFMISQETFNNLWFLKFQTAVSNIDRMLHGSKGYLSQGNS